MSLTYVKLGRSVSGTQQIGKLDVKAGTWRVRFEQPKKVRITRSGTTFKSFGRKRRVYTFDAYVNYQPEAGYLGFDDVEQISGGYGNTIAGSELILHDLSDTYREVVLLNDIEMVPDSGETEGECSTYIAHFELMDRWI